MNDETKKIVSNALGSSTAGIVARCITHPLDTAKARLQATSAEAAAAGVAAKTTTTTSKATTTTTTTITTKPYYKNYKGPIDVMKKTIQNEGILGLYRGFSTVVVGGTPGTILYLCSYDLLKSNLSKTIPPPLTTTTKTKNTTTTNNNENFLIHFLSGMLAETIACIVYVPVDVIKERLQVQHNTTTTNINIKTTTTSNNNTHYYKGGYDALKKILQTEGLRGIYKGYGATLASFGPFSALYFVFYEQFKNYYYTYNNNNKTTTTTTTTTTSTSSSIPFTWILFSSATAGALSSWITSPLDMAKLRLQIQRRQQHYQKNAAAAVATTDVQIVTYRSMIDCLKVTYDSNGIRGLFRGAGARVLHFAPATTITMTCYETCRSFFYDQL